MIIAFEGIDGAGKTTQVYKLKRRLVEEGFEVEALEEPSEGRIGSLIREILREGSWVDQRVMALLFAADRYAQQNKVERLLNEGKIVLLDRCVLSSLAYQGTFTSIEWVRELNRWVRLPDLVVFLNVSVKVAIERLGDKELFESESTLERIARTYHHLLMSDPWRERALIISGEGDPEEIAEEIYRKVRGRISR